MEDINGKIKWPFFAVPNSIIDLDLSSLTVEDENSRKVSKQISVDIYAKMVFICLCRYGEQAFPSYQTIADKCCISRSKAIETVKNLIKLGLLRKRPSESHSTNEYEIIPPHLINIPGSAQHASPSQKDALVRGAHSPVRGAHSPSAQRALNKEIIYKNQHYKNLLPAESVGDPSVENYYYYYYTSKPTPPAPGISEVQLDTFLQGDFVPSTPQKKPKSKEKAYKSKIENGDFDKLNAQDFYHMFQDLYMEKYGLAYAIKASELKDELGILKSSFLNKYDPRDAVNLVLKLFENYENVANEKYPTPTLRCLTQAWLIQKIAKPAYNKEENKAIEVDIDNPTVRSHLKSFGIPEIFDMIESGLVSKELLSELMDPKTMNDAIDRLYKEVIPKWNHAGLKTSVE